MEVKDSGQRQSFATGSVRDVKEGKGNFALLPTRAIMEVAQLYQAGEKKYGKSNWKLGQPLSEFIDSGLRHAFKHLEGQTDERHDIAAVWNFLGLLETQKMIKEGLLPKELDDLEEVRTGKKPLNLEELNEKSAQFIKDNDPLKDIKKDLDFKIPIKYSHYNFYSAQISILYRKDIKHLEMWQDRTINWPESQEYIEIKNKENKISKIKGYEYTATHHGKRWRYSDEKPVTDPWKETHSLAKWRYE